MSISKLPSAIPSATLSSSLGSPPSCVITDRVNKKVTKAPIINAANAPNTVTCEVVSAVACCSAFRTTIKPDSAATNSSNTPRISSMYFLPIPFSINAVTSPMVRDTLFISLRAAISGSAASSLQLFARSIASFKSRSATPSINSYKRSLCVLKEATPLI